MNIVKYSPALRSFNIFNQFDGIFDTLLNSSNSEQYSKRPVVSYSESDSKYFVYVELPGVDKENVSLNISDSLLELEAKRNVLRFDDVKGCNRDDRELNYYYAAELPENIEVNKVKAHFKNGILNIDLPKIKTKSSMSKKIKID